MVLQFNKRYSKGLLVNANYTLSKSKDSGQNSTTFFGSFSTHFDQNNNQLDYGRRTSTAATAWSRASTTRRASCGASRRA